MKRRYVIVDDFIYNGGNCRLLRKEPSTDHIIITVVSNHDNSNMRKWVLITHIHEIAEDLVWREIPTRGDIPKKYFMIRLINDARAALLRNMSRSHDHRWDWV